MEEKDLIAIIFSSIALIVSVLSLWLSNLRPFKLKVLFDAPTFSFYKITPSISGNKENKTWWIPSFDLGISFNNLGKLAGEITDIRIKGEFKTKENTKTIYFYPKWIVNYSVFQKHRTERFNWIDEATIRDWYPLLLPPSGSETIHLILEGDRWDEQIYGDLIFNIEINSSKNKKWKKYGKYDLPITKYRFESKSSVTPYNRELAEIRKS
jgi:hypothetical protein